MIRDQFNSVYAKSYNGFPQGFDPNQGLEQNTVESRPIRTKNTEIRENFDTKTMVEPMKGM